MKKAVIFICAFLFGSIAVLAQTPSSQTLLPLEAILSQPAVGSSCAMRMQDGVVFAAKPPGSITKAYCQATCGSYPSISCSGQQCSAANRNCATGQVGYVTCDGVTTSCPTGPPREFECCECAATNDCFACCYCRGAGPIACAESCS